MTHRYTTPTIGSFIYSDSYGPGLVTSIFIVRKGQPRMMTVLFEDSEKSHVYESEVKVLQSIERKNDGSVSIIFDRQPA